MSVTKKLPWWAPAALFALATVVLFGEFIFSDRMLYGEDTLSLGYMARAFFAERLASGDLLLWSPRLLGGVPTLEALSAGDAVYPASLLYFVTDAYRALGWKLVLHVLAAGFFMYGWARALGLGRPAATIGGLAWLMAPVIVTLVLPGNDGKLMVASLAPLVFWAAHGVLRRPSGLAAGAFAGAVALTCMTTQFQTAYFLFGSVGAYALFRAVRMWRAGKGSLQAADPAGACAGASGRAPRRGLWPAAISLVAFAGAALLGVGVAAFQMIPAFQYVGEHSRRVTTTVEATPAQAVAYSSSWSLHPEEVVGLVVPEFVGNTAADAEWGRGTYWGRNALKLNHEYLGVTVLVLAIFGLLGSRRSGVRWFMAGLGGVWLLYALGTHTPVWRVFFDVVPGMSLFRVPAIAAFLVSFAAVTLCAMGVDDLAREARGAERSDDAPARPARGRRRRAGANARAASFLADRRAHALLAFTGLLLLGLLLQSGGALERLWTTMVHSGAGPRELAALSAAGPFITRGFGLALLLALVASGLVWGAMEKRLPLGWALIGLTALVAVDLGRIDRAFIRTLDYHAWAAPDANVRFLQSRRDAEEPFRVADLRGGGRSAQEVGLAMHGLDLLGGHHPNDLARYRKLLGLLGSQAQGANMQNPNVLRMLNVRYVVLSGGPGAQGPRPASTANTPRGSESVYGYPGLGRAWLVGEAEVVEDDDAALARILSPDFDPERTVLLAEPQGAMALALEAVLEGMPRDSAASGEPDPESDADDGGRPGPAGAAGPDAGVRAGTVEWVVAEPDLRVLRVRSERPALLVFSENWFPGWVAEVNGRAVPVHRANLALQAVGIRTGDHEITLRFTAPTVARALRVSLACAAAVLLLVAWSLVGAVRRRRAG